MGIVLFSPLGPFVPAPPEIAMHMLREQGPAPSFEQNGMPHGNSGMLGQMMGGGPAPIIAMPPSFHHDPRRLRRFVTIYDDAKLNTLLFLFALNTTCYQKQISCRYTSFNA